MKWFYYGFGAFIGFICGTTIEFIFYLLEQSGNKIILDAEHSYIVNKLTGEKTPIEVINGEFQFDIWIPAPSEEHPPIKIIDGKMVALFEENEEGEAEGKTEESVFTRPEEELP